MSSARDFLKSVSANRWLDGLSIVPVAGEHFIEYQTPYHTGIRHRVIKTLGFADRLGYGKWKLLSWAGRHDLPLPVEPFTGEDLLKYVAKVRGPELEDLERHRRIIWRNEGKEGSAREWLRKSGQDRVPAFRIYGPHQTWIVARSGKVLKYSESEFVRQGLVDAERFNVAEYLSRETPVADWGGLPDIKLEKISFWGPGGTYRKSYSEIP